MDTPYSNQAERLRQRLGDLEERVLNGTASPAEISDYQELSAMLSSSLTARVDEIASRFGKAP
jgi:hypothetical protein